jgi:peptidoglycan hydrolase CwlO-like protein
MQIDGDPGTIAGWASAGVLSLLGAIAGIRKFRVLWGADSVTIAAQQAEQTLVNQLHDELTRLSGQNLLLASELNKLQLHIRDLTGQITLLTQENQSLRSEIAALSKRFNIGM